MNPGTTTYSLLVLAGIAISLGLWTRLARDDRRLPVVYFAGLCGAFLGAKLAYLVAEGWLHAGEAGMWLHLATGKSIMGALLGGYAGVEIGKRLVAYPSSTGDRFALIAPVGIILGRLGCLAHGCCLGHDCDPAWYALTDAAGLPRWPAVPVEIAFNLGFLLVLVLFLRPQRRFAGQHFHLYLITYGLFRLGHEAARDTPRVLGSWSGYQLLALLLIGFGIQRYSRSNRARSQPGSAPSGAGRPGRAMGGLGRPTDPRRPAVLPANPRDL